MMRLLHDGQLLSVRSRSGWSFQLSVEILQTTIDGELMSDAMGVHGIEGDVLSGVELDDAPGFIMAIQ